MRIPRSNERVGVIAGGPALEAHASLHVAIVCAIDGVRFAAVAVSERQCLAQIAEYVKEQAAEQLWPPSAGRIHELFDAGDVTGATAEYFRRSGERWDAEWLVITRLPADPGSAVWSGPVPFPKSLSDSRLPRSSARGSAAAVPGLREG